MEFVTVFSINNCLELISVDRFSRNDANKFILLREVCLEDQVSKKFDQVMRVFLRQERPFIRGVYKKNRENHLFDVEVQLTRAFSQ